MKLTKIQIEFLFGFIRICSLIGAGIFFYWSYYFQVILHRKELLDSIMPAAFNYLAFILCIILFHLCTLFINHPHILTNINWKIERTPRKKGSKKKSSKVKEQKKKEEEKKGKKLAIF